MTTVHFQKPYTGIGDGLNQRLNLPYSTTNDGNAPTRLPNQIDEHSSNNEAAYGKSFSNDPDKHLQPPNDQQKVSSLLDCEVR